MTRAQAGVKRRRTVAAAALVVLVAALAACSHGARSDGPNPVPGSDSPDALCRLLSVPLKYAGPKGLSFTELVEAKPGDDGAVGAMVAFGLASDPTMAGDFQPALGFLARRSVVAETPEDEPQPRMPVPTDAIRANARALDEELAHGRCD